MHGHHCCQNKKGTTLFFDTLHDYLLAIFLHLSCIVGSLTWEVELLVRNTHHHSSSTFIVVHIPGQRCSRVCFRMYCLCSKQITWFTSSWSTTYSSDLGATLVPHPKGFRHWPASLRGENFSKAVHFVALSNLPSFHFTRLEGVLFHLERAN